MTNIRKDGFTLIELSIVLVIIGLLAAGILVGRTLIQAAEIRQQISQIQEYKVAIKTFSAKYDALPGDMNADEANAFDFLAGDGSEGHGDGNGIIYACAPSLQVFRDVNLGCETMLFWVHLSQAKLIKQSFNLAGGEVAPDDERPTLSATVTIEKLLPTAALGAGNYLSTFYHEFCTPNNGLLLAGIEGFPVNKPYSAGAKLTPGQAFAIDSKIDDGSPVGGQITSIGVNDNIVSCCHKNNCNVTTDGGGGLVVGGALNLDCRSFSFTPEYLLTPDKIDSPACQISISF